MSDEEENESGSEELTEDQELKDSSLTDEYLKELVQRYEKIRQSQPAYRSLRDKLTSTSVDLIEDPTSLPLDTFHGLFAKIQGNRTYVSRLQVISTENLYLWKSFREEIEGEIKSWIDLALLLPAVQRYRSQSLREAAANKYVPVGFVRLLVRVDRNLSYATILDRQIKTVLDNLNHAYEAVSRQLTVIQMQIELGELTRVDRRSDDDTEEPGDFTITRQRRR